MVTFSETEDAGVTRYADSGSHHDATPYVLAQGAEMGRYVILRTLGAGAMGMVYLGYDPELDRKVALKILRGATSTENRQALIREAQAMARLAHPNVVAVYDVGEHEGRVYVAMEFVEGETLHKWLQAEPRSWREVLDIFVPAGRGLQAAHAQGLIHRDFKPDNVMVSREGQVRVMDFGLASTSTNPKHTSTNTDQNQVDRAISSMASSSLLSKATVGRIAGTPAYMAPEQVSAVDVSPATDQFAFCVSIWEGICGQRPFEGSSIAELFTNVSEKRVRPPPAGARLPGWLTRVLLRGLEPDAAARWPSMAALLTALDRGRRRWRWQAALGAGAASILVVSVLVGLQRRDIRDQRERITACEAEGAVIYAVWNDEARARLRAGLLATEVSFASESANTLIPWLDEYRDTWSSGRTDACLHGFVAHDWSAELLDRSTWCFEDRRLQLEATVDQIATLDATGARRAVRLASYLDPVAACLDPNLLRRLPLPPENQRDEIRSIRAEFTASDRRRHAGNPAEALELAQLARAHAEALDWPPLLANARFIEGRCLFETGRFAEADATLTKAYFEAQNAGSVEVAFRAARSLMNVLSSLQRHREAEIWADHADLFATELADPSGLDRAEGHYLRMEIEFGLGDYEAAAEQGELALSMRAAALGADHPITAAVTRNLGWIYLMQGRAVEALELFERSHAIWLDAVGHEHPHVGTLVMLRGSALLELGRVDEALALQQEGLAIHERVLRTNHPKIADSLEALAEAYVALGRLDEAEQAQRRVIAIRHDKLGLRGPAIAMGLLNMSVIDRARGRHAEALELCNQALELLETSLEPDHPNIALALERTADVYLDMGRFDQAIPRRREALARRESARGPNDRQLMTPLAQLGDAQQLATDLDGARQSYTRALAIGERVATNTSYILLPSLIGLAEVSLADGELGEALRFSERAVRIAEDDGASPRTSGPAHFVLARALAADGDPEARATALGQRAQLEFTTTHDDLRRAQVEAWLAGVSGPGVEP